MVVRLCVMFACFAALITSVEAQDMPTSLVCTSNAKQRVTMALRRNNGRARFRLTHRRCLGSAQSGRDNQMLSVETRFSLPLIRQLQ